MASVQLAETEGADVGSGSGEDEEEDDDGEEEEEEAAGEEQEQEQEEEEGEKEEEEDNEEEEEDEEVSGSEPRSKSKPKSKSKSKPSVPKAIEEADNVDIDIAARVASDRLRSERRQTKHHGRKAHAGAVGRQTGSKAKTDKRRLVKDSLTF